mmetsp:Transcript_9091/g.27682  ORF Transcript_9091/g.27682 Transcript_9091/m.27682 type:complete len:238 (+) Transcript_9091:1270-1983(+)
MATVTRHASVAPHADATLHASKQGLSRWTRMSVSCRLSCARALFFIHTGMPAWGCCRPSRAACRRLVLAVFLLPQNLPKNCGWVTLYRRKIRLSAPRPCSAAPDRRAPRRPRDHGAGSGAQPWACPGAGERVPCLAAFEPGRWPKFGLLDLFFGGISTQRTRPAPHPTPPLPLWRAEGKGRGRRCELPYVQYPRHGSSACLWPCSWARPWPRGRRQARRPRRRICLARLWMFLGWGV